MTDKLDFETRLGERLRARAALASRPFDAAAIARDAVATNPRRRGITLLQWRPTIARAALILLALAGLLLATVVAALLVGSRTPHLSSDVRAGEVIDGINGREVEKLRSMLSGATVVLPQLASDGSDASERREFPVDFGSFLEAWIYAVDAWDLQATLGPCRHQGESVVRCSVVTRWHSIQVELEEEWTFTFDGTSLTRLEMVRVDPNPSNRSLRLGLAGLESWESWESWLKAEHPAEVARLEGSRLFWNFYFRYHPSLAPEIGASIREYVEGLP